MATWDNDLERLFNDRYRPMVRLATWLVGDRTSAEEIVQDAFVALADQRLSAGSVWAGSLESPEAYLRTAVVNRTRSHHRRRAMKRRLLPRAVEPERTSPSPDELMVDDELAAAVAELPRRQRECVVLRYTEDLTVDAIARILGIGAGSVKTHLHRALKTLEATLGPAGARNQAEETSR